jgi:hypothetical protein
VLVTIMKQTHVAVMMIRPAILGFPLLSPLGVCHRQQAHRAVGVMDALLLAMDLRHLSIVSFFHRGKESLYGGEERAPRLGEEHGRSPD